MELQIHESEAGVSVIVPAFNEERGIGGTLEQLKDVMEDARRPYEIVVVDDGSTDATAEVVGRYEGVRLIRNARNMGYGAALKRGIGVATHPIIAITDADGTYPNARIPDLADRLTDDVDMVVGWRKGMKAKIPLLRRPAKWVMRKFAESLSAHPIADLNSGLRVFRKEQALRFRNVLPNGFSFTTTITLMVLNTGGAIVYEPIEYYRREGSSKFHPIKDVIGMVSLIVRSILLIYPMRVFVPLALLCFAAATCVFLAGLFWLERLPDATVVILVTTGLQLLFMGFLADLINRRYTP